MTCADSEPWSGADRATEKGDATKLPRRRREDYRASENAEGGDCWVSQLKLRRHALNIDARLGESAGLLCFRGSRDYSETTIQRKARFAERPQIISAYTQPAYSP